MINVNDKARGQHEILVVDDHEASLQLLTRILERDGFRVKAASNGESALRLTAAWTPDLILLDIKMPDIDGFEVCRRLKLDEKQRDVPVIFVSGLEHVSHKMKGFAVGGVDYITKPFAQEEVLTRVKLHLRLRDLTEHLELKVQERTAELAEANLKLQREIEYRRQSDGQVIQLTKFPEENPNPVLRVSADGQVLYRNPAACELSEWRCEAGEQVPMGLGDLVDQAFARGQMVVTEFDSGERTYHVCVAPLHGESYANIYGLDVTERKKLENELRIALQRAEEGRQILETLMKYVPEGITIADSDFNIRLVSHHGEELLGGTHNQQGITEVARHWAVYDADGITPLPEENLPLVKAIRNGIVVNDQELVQMNADGAPIALRCNAAPIRNDEGEITGGIVAWRDIRERKRAEQELAKTKERLERVLSSITEGYYALDSEWRFIEANPRTEEHFGLTRDQLLGQNIWELTHSAPDSPNYQNFLEVMEQQTPRRFEAHSELIPDLWVEIYLYPRDGALDVYFTDITDRKRLEEALRQSEAHYRELVQNTNSAIIRWKSNGTLTFFNEFAQDFFGYRQEEVVGKHVSMLVPETESSGVDLTRLAEYIVAHPEQFVNNVNENLRKDGSRVWMTWTNRPFFDENGQVKEILAVGNDITEQKLVEARAEQMAAQRQLALNAAKLGWWHYDPISGIAYYDQRYTEIFGVSGTEMNNEEILKLLHPDDLPKVWAAVEAALNPQSPASYSVEYRVNRPDGSMRWVEAHGLASFESDHDGPRAISFVGTVEDITERKRAESALRESEEKFSTAFRLNPSAMVISNTADGGYIEANSAFERIMGWSREEMVGSTSLERGIWPDVDERQRFLAQLGSQGYLRDVETKFRAKDGALKTVIYSAEMITLDNKPFMLSTWTDITERKQTEEALRESEERFRTILYSIGDAVITTDTECRVRHMNPIAESLTGWTEAAAQGKPLTEVFHIVNEHTRVEVENPAERVLREGEIVGLANHTMLIARDGTMWPIADSGSPIKTGEGRVTGVVLVFRDQAVERAAAAALAESEARFRLALRNAPISVAAQDRDLRYVWAYNQRTMRPEDIVGKLDQDIFTPNEAAHLTSVKRRVLEKNVEAREQMWLERPNGRMFLDLCFEPILDKDGQPIGVGTTTIDLTPTKIVEMELEHAREAAEAANQAKSQFLANMSHEIRTPMNGVLGMTDLALMKSTNPQVKEYLGYVKESGLHLLDIINDILDLSRIESGRIKLNRDRFSLRDFLDITIEPLLSAFVAKDVNFTIDIDSVIPDPLIGDYGRLRQVLINLLGNALKFTDRGNVSLLVESIDGAGVDGQIPLRFCVCDTGIGIPPTHLEKIFDSFEQVHVAHHAKYEGTGLGLSISKNLVELMGGEIWVESREGVGSAFYFTVTLERTPAEESIKSEGSAPTGFTDRSLNILVAEDTMVNQILIQTVLEDAGHRVVIAETGRQVLEHLAGGDFDLVLMDIRMPEMNGDEATRIIRQNPPPGVNPRIPIIALTAYALDTERARYMDSGFDAYLTKPVEVEKLNRILAELG